jgi:hypothetical protein
MHGETTRFPNCRSKFEAKKRANMCSLLDMSLGHATRVDPVYSQRFRMLHGGSQRTPYVVMRLILNSLSANPPAGNNQSCPLQHTKCVNHFHLAYGLYHCTRSTSLMLPYRPKVRRSGCNVRRYKSFKYFVPKLQAIERDSQSSCHYTEAPAATRERYARAQ